MKRRAGPTLPLRVRVDLFDNGGGYAGTTGEHEVAVVDLPEVDLARLEVVGQRKQVFCRVDDVIGDSQRPADDIGVAAGQEGHRYVSSRQPVRHLVHRPVAAEGDHDVIVAVDRVAADLRRVVLALGRFDFDLVAALEGVDDQVLQAVRDRRRVGVDDDQHPAFAVRPGHGRLRVHGVTSKVEYFSPAFSMTRPSSIRMSMCPITSERVR